MRSIKLLLPILSIILLMSCTKDEAPTEEKKEKRNLEVEEFTFRGMYLIYLYKSDIPELTENYFANDGDIWDFFATFDNPEDFFYEGLRSSRDRFSVLVDDYLTLENRSAGIAKTNGMEVIFGTITGTDNMFGIVKYILPNTSAEEAGVKRGHIFTEIDGEKMTNSNYLDLFNQSSYTIDLNIMEDGIITPLNETASLNRVEYSTNPILTSKTIDLDGIKVGYIMYNRFTDSYDDELNAAFGELQAQGVQELVLDLRYNGGGSMESAVNLSSMITGQFEGEVFARQQWNDTYQAHYESTDPERLVRRFNKHVTIDKGTEQERKEAINSLGLNRVYVLTTGSSASASELVISSLKPYIDVVQIGTPTVGKFQASLRMYDSETFFTKEGINTNHTYAMQLITSTIADKNGVPGNENGLTPDIHIVEDPNNYGQLGDPSEPLLNTALNDIAGAPQKHQQVSKAKESARKFEIIGESGMDSPDYQRMYDQSIPSLIRE